MKAIDLAKKLRPELSEKDIILGLCPDDLLIFEDEILCKSDKYRESRANCTKCWNQKVSKVKVDWLLESFALYKLAEKERINDE